MMYSNVITNKSEGFRKFMDVIDDICSQLDALTDSNLSVKDEWVQADVVLKRLGISLRTLQTWRDHGILGFSTLGSKIYYSSSEIDEVLHKNYVTR